MNKFKFIIITMLAIGIWVSPASAEKALLSDKDLGSITGQANWEEFKLKEPIERTKNGGVSKSVSYNIFMHRADNEIGPVNNPSKNFNTNMFDNKGFEIIDEVEQIRNLNIYINEMKFPQGYKGIKNSTQILHLKF